MVDKVKIIDLLRNNVDWADRKTGKDPEYFQRLAKQQAPEFLWIGCSDSRVPANDIVGLNPGELFVHRNVANIANDTDSNYLSVLQFAIEYLKIRHVIVCGHYGCGGIERAMQGDGGELIDGWLAPIRGASDLLGDEYHGLKGHDVQHDALCEVNVVDQVRSVAMSSIVQKAWGRGQSLAVHGWIYSIRDGLLQDLDISVRNAKEADTLFSDRRTSLQLAPGLQK